MDNITKDELRELLAASGGDKYFFDRDTTFIKEQNITVQSGANFYNGSQPKQKGEQVAEETKKTEASTARQAGLSTMDRVNNGLKAVVKGGFMKSDYYYAALVKFINEKDFFGSQINFADMEGILQKSGLFEDGKCPKKGTIARISISGKFPNWKTDKSIDVWMDLKNLTDVFHAAYNG